MAVWPMVDCCYIGNGIYVYNSQMMAEFIDELGNCRLLREFAHDTITYVRILNCDMV
jgi:hypothetical protein